MSRKVEVCLSPRLVDRYDLTNRIVVVTDVLRATSAMVAGLASGVVAIRPVETVEASAALRAHGYLAAAEREGQVVEGFDFGNSPYAFMRPEVQGQKIALTTTNGTRAIALVVNAPLVLIGAFVNLEAIVDFLKNRSEDVLILCSGWKDNFNLEDSLFAGAVVAGLRGPEVHSCDAGLATALLYDQLQHDLFGAIQRSSHYHRLAKMGIEEDIRFCMQRNVFSVVPVLRNGEIVL
ncbi:MAG: 2-phosphosulfolactate phosphatase [Sphingobacteriaceae bacterium]|nr:2-phosphosulfolactate phosphatase [Sphingobacteriaceae bacterium]